MSRRIALIIVAFLTLKWCNGSGPENISYDSCNVTATCGNAITSINMLSVPTTDEHSSRRLLDVISEINSLEMKITAFDDRFATSVHQQNGIIVGENNNMAEIERRLPRIERYLVSEPGSLRLHLRNGWFDPNNGYEYLIPKEYLAFNYDDARNICINQFHSKIATVGMRQQNTRSLLRSYFHRVQVIYFGLTDRVQEGRWVWDDGEELQPDQSNWRSGEPNNLNYDYTGHGEDCAFIAPRPQYQWNDSPCGTPGFVLCERPIQYQK
nr:C-type lectin domain family 4 member M-like [Ciona intestinalis]|eukprot:XP_026689560.1 C-type lectin domain family 4 member M-like [Ciona intestinalis]